MRTARALTVSPSMLCTGGGFLVRGVPGLGRVPGPGGVPGLRGVPAPDEGVASQHALSRPLPCEQNHRRV